MRLKILFLGAIALTFGAADAQTGSDPEGYTVEVSFSDKIERRLESIDRVERRFEERFRSRRHYQGPAAAAGTQRFAANRTAGTQWAGERLIADSDQFTLENLVRSLVAYNVNRAVPGFNGRIEFELQEIGLSNPPLAFMKRIRSSASGNLKVTLQDGTVRFNDRVRVNLVVDPMVDLSYDGPELAFSETDPSLRVGPTLAYLVERALERVWPELREEIVGPVVVRVSGPNERVVQGRLGF